MNPSFHVTKSCMFHESIHVSLLYKSVHFYIQSLLHVSISRFWEQPEKIRIKETGCFDSHLLQCTPFHSPSLFLHSQGFLWSPPSLRQFNHIHWVLRRQDRPVSYIFLVQLAVGNSKPQSEDGRFWGTGTGQRKFTLTGSGWWRWGGGGGALKSPVGGP